MAITALVSTAVDPLGRSGDRFDSIDGLIEHLQTWSAEASELDPTRVDGLEIIGQR